MGSTRFIRHKVALYVGRVITGLMNGASIPASQIYVRIFHWNDFLEMTSILQNYKIHTFEMKTEE